MDLHLLVRNVTSVAPVILVIAVIEYFALAWLAYRRKVKSFYGSSSPSIAPRSTIDDWLWLVEESVTVGAGAGILFMFAHVILFHAVRPVTHTPILIVIFILLADITVVYAELSARPRHASGPRPWAHILFIVVLTPICAALCAVAFYQFSRILA